LRTENEVGVSEREWRKEGSSNLLMVMIIANI